MNFADHLKTPVKSGSTVVSINLRALSDLLKKGVPVPKIILGVPSPRSDANPRT